MKRETVKTALRTCCAERTRAMQLAACVHIVLAPVNSRSVCDEAGMGVQV